MKVAKIFLSILLIAAANTAQSQQKYVEVRVEKSNATSELKEMVVGATPNLTKASVGLMYFGPESESDISFLMFLEGAKGRYSQETTYGVRLFAGDTALSPNKLRMVDRIDKDGKRDLIAIHLTTEELAWLISSDGVKIELYDADAEKRLDTLTFTPTGFRELKQFGKSVLMIKGTYN